MIFARLSVDVYSHPRFIEAGFEASGYWMFVLAFLRHHESSDGFLAERFITVPLATPKQVARRLCDKLVSVGLFGKVEGGYVLLRYTEKNDAKEVIEENKTATRQRKVRWKGTPALRPDPERVPHTGSEGGAGTRSERVPALTINYHSPSHSESVLDHREAGRDPDPPEAGARREEAREKAAVCMAERGGRHAGPPLRPLPPSERALSGSYWLAAFTEGITQQTGRPCTAGRMYVATLERIVAHHAPERDAARACAWIRDQAAAFAAKWDGQHPPKGLTPDGLERWLNDGRSGPPQFGKQKILQLPASDWKPDDFSDYGARVIRADGGDTQNGKEQS